MPASNPATLLIQTAFIGDVILMTALLEYLHDTEPDTPVDVLVRRGNEGLLAGHPHVRQVLIWDKKHRKYAGLVQLLQQIRATRYGRVVTLQRFASTGFLTAFSRAKERVGFAKNPLSRFFTRRVRHVIGDGTHEVERNLALLRDTEGLPVDSSITSPRLYPSAADEARPQATLPVGPTCAWHLRRCGLPSNIPRRSGWSSCRLCPPGCGCSCWVGRPMQLPASGWPQPATAKTW